MTGKNVTFKIGDKVIYVGAYNGVVISKTDVLLDDGTTVKSLVSQTHKFVKIK